MPEGHTIHRLAGRHQRLLRGRPVRVDSPQGRFVEGAALIDGLALARTEAWGKHLFHVYADPADRADGRRRATGQQWLHVHLGLFGKFRDGTGEPPEPRGALRLRLVTVDQVTAEDGREAAWVELRGPTACELLTRPEVEAILARLGPDPLRRDADPEPFLRRAGRSRARAGTLLMDQAVVAGVGNVYRAEVLFRHGVHPDTPGRDVDPAVWAAIWADLAELMRAGVRSGRIVTTRPADRERPAGRPRRGDAYYVYRRTGLPCRLCGTAVRTDVLAARNVFWCPVCQPEG